MEFVLNTAELKEIYKVCGGCMSDKPQKEILQYVRVAVDGGTLIAYGQDGYSLARLELTMYFPTSKGGHCLLPVVKIPKGRRTGDSCGGEIQSYDGFYGWYNTAADNYRYCDGLSGIGESGSVLWT